MTLLPLPFREFLIAEVQVVAFVARSHAASRKQMRRRGGAQETPLDSYTQTLLVWPHLASADDNTHPNILGILAHNTIEASAVGPLTTHLEFIPSFLVFPLLTLASHRAGPHGSRSTLAITPTKAHHIVADTRAMTGLGCLPPAVRGQSSSSSHNCNTPALGRRSAVTAA